MDRSIRLRHAATIAVALFLINSLSAVGAAQPVVLDASLEVHTVTSGLSGPTTMAYIGADDFLILEKNSGRVLRVTNGVVQGAVLDLAVNFASERGLLGIALHPDFPVDPGVYLFWTESASGFDTGVLSDVPLLGNRVDRFVWNGTHLGFGNNILTMRARQTDNSEVPGHPGTGNAAELGSHNGGAIAFGPDGKLYTFLGEVGRRGQLQNLPTGPFATAPFVDDLFGGPQPDPAHLAGVVLRLNADGSTPPDNPFFAAGGAIGGAVGASVQRVFSYGHRNGFGVTFDPASGDLWISENGDDAFGELNRVVAGMNGGWVQVAGPIDRVDQFRTIEMTAGSQDLQQVRWPATNIAQTPAEAMARLFMLPGAHYRDPVLGWKWDIAPGALGFLLGDGLGASYTDNLFMGAATTELEEGFLFRLPLTPDRTGIDVSDPRLADGVADNLARFDITESEELLFGSGFGVVTFVGTSPAGNLVLVSHSHGAVYEIIRRPPDDTSPPECGPISIIRNGEGNLVAIESTVADSESGIASVTFTTLRNLRGYVGASGPYIQGQTFSFALPGPTTATIRGERIDMTKGGTLVVRVTNGAGLQRDCDPVVSQLSATIPEGFGLEPAYPNPARAGSVVRIGFALAESALTRITVFDMLGREVVRLVDDAMEPGRYELSWTGDDANGRPLAPGAYVYRIDAGSYSRALHLVVLR